MAKYNIYIENKDKRGMAVKLNKMELMTLILDELENQKSIDLKIMVMEKENEDKKSK